LRVRHRCSVQRGRERDQAAHPPEEATVNAEGGEITLVFDQATVELDALQRSAYALAAEMTTDVRVSGGDYVCTLYRRGQDITDDELKHRFRAEVNDQVLRVRIARETEPLRNLVFALAFSQTGLSQTGLSEAGLSQSGETA
jgi:His-Xaa-Ser system protein HxsD